MPDISALFDQFSQFVISHATAIVIGTFVALVILPSIRLIARLWRRARVFFHSRRRALNSVVREKKSGGKVEGAGPWLLEPIDPPDDYRRGIQSARILAVANYKGGVGKTTVAANIGACLAKKYDRNVLLIDLDFQGSLSAMAFAAKDWQPKPDEDSVASALISGDLTPNDIFKMAKPVAGQENLQVIKAHYDLAQADNRLLIEWLLAPEPQKPSSLANRLVDLFYGKIYRQKDMRFNLARVLHSETMADAYDAIIIDCPPRLTSSAVQALTASSHVLVPAIMDQTSSDTVVRYFYQLTKLQEKLCPHLKSIGIVPAKYQSTLNSTERAVDGLKALNSRGALDVKLVDAQCFIPYTTTLLDAQQEGIAYLYLGEAQNVANLKAAIEALTQHVINKVGIPLP